MSTLESSFPRVSSLALMAVVAACGDPIGTPPPSLLTYLDEAKLTTAKRRYTPGAEELTREIQMGPVRRKALVFPLDARLSIPVELPPEAVFEFHLALSRTGGSSAEAEFVVGIESSDRRARVFKEVFSHNQLQVWNERRADLTAWSGRRVIMNLEARIAPQPSPGLEAAIDENKKSLAVWAEPTITTTQGRRAGLGVSLFNQWQRQASEGSLTIRSRRVADTKFSHDRGFYDYPFTLRITSSTRGATVVYTTNGSEPSPTNGTAGNALFINDTTVVRALAYKAGMEPTNVDTHTYIFPTKVENQSDTTRIPKDARDSYALMFDTENGVSGAWGDKESGRVPLVPVNPWDALDTEIDPDVVGDSGHAEFVRGLLSIPTLSIVMSEDDLMGPREGIYPNLKTRRGWKRRSSVELIYPNDPRFSEFQGFQIDCGIRMHGSSGVAKRSFRLLFRKEYGPGKLRYPFLESAVHHADSAAREFDTLILRGGGQEDWSGLRQPALRSELALYTRDQHVRDTQIYLSGLSARGIFVHVYLNGLYWGLYNAVERVDQQFLATYLGGEEEDWFAMSQGGPLRNASDAHHEKWQAMHQYAETNDLSDPENYRRLKTLLDTERFSDYILLNWFTGMGDWGTNNWYGAMRLIPPGPALYFCWDSEFTYGLFPPYGNPTAWVNPASLGANDAPIHRLWRALDDNRSFRIEFADRVYRACFNGGPLEDLVNKANFRNVCDYVEDAIVCESARWGDTAEGTEDRPRTREKDWIPERDRVLNQVMEGNVGRFIDALRAVGYYPSINPPEVEVDGSKMTLSVPAGAEEVYYTTDGTDPMSPGVSSFREAKKTIPFSARLKARARVGEEWSALYESGLWQHLIDGGDTPLR